MSLVDLHRKITELHLVSKVNSLTEHGTGEKLVMFSLTDMLYVNEKISPTEYEDVRDFIKKLLSGTPLRKLGSEKKTELGEDDFIYY